MINRRKIFLINVGDARGILISDDSVEQQRIFEAGGTITKKPSQHILRVERRLAMARVLGDFSLNNAILHLDQPSRRLDQVPERILPGYS